MTGLRVALIGAGGIAHAHLPAWLELGAEVSVFSLDGTEQLIADCAGGRACSSLEEAFAGADAADVCVPTYDHRSIVEQAAAAGLDVICEKPLGRTAADVRAMIEACDRAGVQLYPGHVVRFFAEYALMHEQVAGGALGRIAVQRFSRTGSRPRMDWFHDETRSGGIVLDQMVHDLDFACWNAGPATRVFGRLRRTGTPGSGIDVGQLVLTHASGAISYLTGTWARPGTAFRTTFEIAGTDGLLQHDSSDHPALRFDGGLPDAGTVPSVLAGGAGTGLLPSLVGVESPYLTEIREVAAAFAGGPAPRVSALDGLQAVVLAEAAQRSIREGRAVDVEPVLAATEGVHA